MADGVILSVVIPFYNGIEDVVALVEHLNSDDGRFEVVLVNDGSTVCSGEKLAAKFSDYDNVTLASYDDNRGVSTARNEGIRIAHGEYIWMVDADDHVTQTDVLRAVEWIEKTNGKFDALFFDWASEPSRQSAQPIRAIEFSKDDALRRVYERDGYVWDKIFRRQTIVGNDILFDEQLFWAEDKLFCAQFLASSTDGLYLTSSVLYCHVKRGTSFTGSKKVDTKRLTLIDSKRQLLELSKGLQVEGLTETAQADLISDALMLLFRLIKQRPNGWRECWKKYWAVISSYREGYLKNQALLPKYRLFLRFCPGIDFILRKTKEVAA